MRLAVLFSFSLLLGAVGGLAAADPQALIDDLFARSEQAYRDGDFAEAFELTGKAAEAGNPQAQFNLGVLYSKGQGTKKNYAKALHWFLQAADQGHRGAMLNASVILDQGLGVAKDPRLAEDLRRMAGEPGKAKAPAPPAAKAEPAPSAAARPAPALPRGRPPWAAALLLGAAALAGGLLLSQSRQASRPALDGMLSTIRSPKATASQAYDAFQLYHRHGGDISAIPADRLHEVFLAAGREADLVQLSSLSPLQALSLAKRFAESGRAAEARKLLGSDQALLGLPPDEFVIRDAIRVLERSGALGDLARRLSKAPSETAAVFAKALLWLDKSSLCADILNSRKSRTAEEERLLALAQGVASSPKPAAARTPSMPPPSALLNGKYELRAKVGEGGMGVVYEGYEPHLDRKVAVKRMRHEIHSDPAIRRRFIAEARMIAKVRHPYIVAIHDVVEEGEDLYLILDFVDGKTLSGLIAERGRLPLTECKEVLRYVCEAVSFAHRLKVLHRDLKPDNVIINKEGFAMVMDFGLAREAKETLSRVSTLEVSGSPAYMPPEQHMGATFGASDVYALGAMFYQMLTGQLPFPGPDFLSQKERLLYARPSQTVPGVSARCDDLLALTFDPDPKTRISDPAVFYEKLRAA